MRYVITSSQQVSWWSVHEHVSPLLELVGSWPMVGAPAWCELDDRNPVKKAALYDAARHWALHVECGQQARCAAAKDVAAAEDWLAIAREIRSREAFFASRPWLRRVVA